MDSGRRTPRLANIRLHPIKALDPVSVNEARIGPNGGLELDRVWALYSADGRWVNGKRTAAMHLIRAAFAPDIRSVTLTVPGDRRNIPAMTFDFPGDTDGAGEWFSMYFEQAIQVRYTREGFPDDGLAPGPTIVSTASLEAVRDWFPGLTLDEARRRFRTTLEIDAAGGTGTRHAYGHEIAAEKLPAFWEDQLFADDESRVVRFKIGDVAFEGSNPCARCPVPSRESETGITNDGFQKRFTDLRRAQLPPWAPAERFDHFYRLAINTRVPSTECGKLLSVGDVVELS
ncbi:MAG TPA: MOSC N-terminal beta barrel domain-containing protein [Candidatus Acidoferrum sp.]|nr:MOSC N-terminal beta barrel domain-containing protein [Candidatus Acidoferrum sp.]